MSYPSKPVSMIQWFALTVALFVPYCAVITFQTNEVIQLDNNVAELYQQGKYNEAIPVAQKALRMTEEHWPNSEHLAESIDRLARLYFDIGRYAEAELLYQRSLQIWEKILGPEHPDIAYKVNIMAELYFKTGKYSEATTFFERSMDIWEKALGLKHPMAARNMNRLAQIYFQTRNHAGARQILNKFENIKKEKQGSNYGSPYDNEHINSLISIYDSDYYWAESLFKHNLSTIEKALGPEHPDVALSLDNLAYLYRVKGNFTKAEPLYKRSLDILEKALGSEHIDVATCLNHLAGCYNEMGNYVQAAALYERSIAIYEKRLDTEHPSVANNLQNLAYNQALIGN